MKALIDTNIILDVFLEREPFFQDSWKIMRMAEARDFFGYISSSAITDIFYFTQKKFKDIELVYKKFEQLTVILTVVPVAGTTIKTALALRWKDFEDAVQYVAAKENAIDRIITRNTADFEAADIPRATPAEFLAAW